MNRMSEKQKEKFVVIREEEDGKEILKAEIKEEDGEGFCYIETDPKRKKVTLSCEGKLDKIRKILETPFFRKRIDQI